MNIFRADFWAYAGIYAVNATVEIANSKCNSTKCLVPNPGIQSFFLCMMYSETLNNEYIERIYQMSS